MRGDTPRRPDVDVVAWIAADRALAAVLALALCLLGLAVAVG